MYLFINLTHSLPKSPLKSPILNRFSVEENILEWNSQDPESISFYVHPTFSTLFLPVPNMYLFVISWNSFSYTVH